MEKCVDVLVVGAGLQGLVAAKTYLACEPGVDLLIMDSNSSVGGVWAKENIYPGLRSNNLLGTYEYTDFPMRAAGLGVKEEEHIPGDSIYEYFRRYAETFDLMRRIQFKSIVRSAEQVDSGWRLQVLETGESSSHASVQTAPQSSTIRCRKIIVATGVNSAPNAINIAGSADFDRPLLSFASLGRSASEILSSPFISNVTITGGSKSAFDAVYMFASAGKRVDWVIRPAGHGATYMGPAYIHLGPFKTWLESLPDLRPLTWFSPCLWGDSDGFTSIRRLLHNTRWGRATVDAFWWAIGAALIRQTGLNASEELMVLKPDESVFWYGAGLGTLNYPSNFHDFLKDGTVRVRKDDIKQLEKDTIVFRDGQSLKTDALICVTGWEWRGSIAFLSSEMHAELGLPSTRYTPSQRAQWDALDRRADAEILQRFPRLATRPTKDFNREDLLLAQPGVRTRKGTLIDDENNGCDDSEAQPMKQQHTPWRLWRGMVPPGQACGGERNLVFLGVVSNAHSALRCEISSLWAYAWLNKRLDEPARALSSGSDESDIYYETALLSRFGHWRYPYGYGARFPDFVFDSVPYLDLLVHDLGLNHWRKGWGWVGEVFGGSYGQRDYRGLVTEWLRKEERWRKRKAD